MTTSEDIKRDSGLRINSHLCSLITGDAADQASRAIDELKPTGPSTERQKGEPFATTPRTIGRVYTINSSSSGGSVRIVVGDIEGT